MFNLIGAVLVTAFVLGLVMRRASFAEGEAKIKAVPVALHVVIVTYLILLSIQGGTKLFDNFAPVSIPDFLISGLNIWVHEAGHIYFRWGFTFIAVLGGTLNEILFPLLPAIYCWRKKYFYLCSLFIFWLGHNLFGISPYVADARARALPLLGDEDSIHDWEYMLSQLGLLNYDLAISKFIWLLAWPILIASVTLYIRTINPKFLSKKFFNKLKKT